MKESLLRYEEDKRNKALSIAEKETNDAYSHRSQVSEKFFKPEGGSSSNRRVLNRKAEGKEGLEIEEEEDEKDEQEEEKKGFESVDEEDDNESAQRESKRSDNEEEDAELKKGKKQKLKAEKRMKAIQDMPKDGQIYEDRTVTSYSSNA